MVDALDELMARRDALRAQQAAKRTEIAEAQAPRQLSDEEKLGRILLQILPTAAGYALNGRRGVKAGAKGALSASAAFKEREGEDRKRALAPLMAEQEALGTEYESTGDLIGDLQLESVKQGGASALQTQKDIAADQRNREDNNRALAVQMTRDKTKKEIAGMEDSTKKQLAGMKADLERELTQVKESGLEGRAEKTNAIKLKLKEIDGEQKKLDNANDLTVAEIKIRADSLLQEMKGAQSMEKSRYEQGKQGERQTAGFQQEDKTLDKTQAYGKAQSIFKEGKEDARLAKTESGKMDRQMMGDAATSARQGKDITSRELIAGQNQEGLDRRQGISEAATSARQGRDIASRQAMAGLKEQGLDKRQGVSEAGSMERLQYGDAATSARQDKELASRQATAELKEQGLDRRQGVSETGSMERLQYGESEKGLRQDKELTSREAMAELKEQGLNDRLSQQIAASAAEIKAKDANAQRIERLKDELGDGNKRGLSEKTVSELTDWTETSTRLRGLVDTIARSGNNKLRRAFGSIGANDEYFSALNAMQFYGVRLARIGGEVGTMTDKDVERVSKVFTPKYRESIGTYIKRATEEIEILERKMETKLKGLEASGFDTEGLTGVLKDANKKPDIREVVDNLTSVLDKLGV